MGFKDTLFDIGDEVNGLFGGKTDKQKARKADEDRARAISEQRRGAHAAWIAVGRVGPNPAPEFGTEADTKELQRSKDFQEVQKLRDKPILGSTNFTSILSPKRNTKGVQKQAVASDPGADLSQGPGPGPAKPSPGGAFGDGSVLASRKRKRTILG